MIEILGSAAEPVADITHRADFWQIENKHHHQMRSAGEAILVHIGLAHGHQFINKNRSNLEII